MRIQSLVAGVLVTAAVAAGCGSGSAGTRAESAGTSDSAHASIAQSVVTQDQLRRGVREIVDAGTGRSISVVALPPDDPALAAMLPTVEGEWNVAEKLLKTVTTSDDPDVGRLTLTAIVIGKMGYGQALYDGSELAPNCWVHPDVHASSYPATLAALAAAQARESPGEHAANVTMPLRQVLESLGFQKLVNTSAEQLKGARVDATVRFSSGEIRGWGVTDEAIVAALEPDGADNPTLAARFFGAMPGAQWEVSLRGLGMPVDIQEPPSSLILGPGETACRS